MLVDKKPENRSTPNASDRTRLRLKAWWSQIVRAWLSIHLTSYGGKYSIERMLALDEYIRTTSLWRVLLVIFATPVPMALLVIAQELIPVQDPAEGWKANYGFWIRVLILESLVPLTLAIHGAIYIGRATLSTRQLVGFCIFVSVLSTAAQMGFTACWTFPVPFFTISLSIALFFMMAVVFRAIVGGHAFREICTHKEQLVEYSKFNTMEVVLMITYPTFQVLFQAVAHTKWEQPTMLLLPLIKLVLKHIYTRIYKTKEDMLPEEVTFSVIFFDVLYLATCMQSIRSLKTVMLIMAVDVIETVIELRELHHRTRTIRARLQQLTGSTTTNLLGSVKVLCGQIKDVSQGRTSSDIRLRSCINSPRISHRSSLLLQKMDAQYMPVSSIRRHSVEAAVPTTTALVPMLNPKWWQRVLRGSDVQPMTTAILVSPIWTPSGSLRDRQPVNDRVATLEEALEALFTAECLVLAEYVETFIPILYANYILLMVHLPSAKYHQEMQGVTAENVGGTVESVFLYGLLELVSFIALAVIMRRNCGIQALYHLGFVLETQKALVQSKMLVWTVTTLTYRIVHFGKVVYACTTAQGCSIIF
jgi:hypothetical protein